MSTTTDPDLGAYRRIQPALVGGSVMGVLSALPIISAGNLCCCLWVVSGGLVATYLMQQEQTVPVAPAAAALTGLLAGVFGAVIYLALSVPINALVAPMQRRVVERLIEGGGIPPEFRDYMDGYIGGPTGLAVSFFAMLMAGAVFSTLGGLLGTIVFRRSPPGAGVNRRPPE